MPSLYFAYSLSSLINNANAMPNEPSLPPRPTLDNIFLILNTNL